MAIGKLQVWLDEEGIPIADCEVAEEVNIALEQARSPRTGFSFIFHISNLLVLQVLRAALHKMPKDERPSITWTIYGKVAHFNDDLRSNDAWEHPLMNINEDALDELLRI